MHLTKKPVLIMLTLFIILTLTAGCGRAATSDTDTERSNSSDSSDSSTSDSDSSGATSSMSVDGMDYQFGEDLKLPRKFPTKTAPLYKENGVFMTLGDDDSENWSIGYRSKAKFKDVNDFYMKNFKDAANKSEILSEEGSFLFYESDGYSITIVITEQSEAEGSTDVVLTLVPAQN